MKLQHLVKTGSLPDDAKVGLSSVSVISGGYSDISSSSSAPPAPPCVPPPPAPPPPGPPPPPVPGRVECFYFIHFIFFNLTEILMCLMNILL